MALDPMRKNETALGSWDFPCIAVLTVSGKVNDALDFSTSCAISMLAVQQRMQKIAATFLVTISPPFDCFG
jgi:hypothetical protein